MTPRINNAIEVLVDALRKEAPETTVTFNLFVNCQEWKVETSSATAAKLKENGVSMRNLRGDFIRENADPKSPLQEGRTSAFHEATCSASEYRGARCPICFWALYDGDWCQGPKWCSNRGKSVEKPIRLTNAEAMEMIRHYCQTCGRHHPCRHCEPDSNPLPELGESNQHQ